MRQHKLIKAYANYFINRYMPLRKKKKEPKDRIKDFWESKWGKKYIFENQQ